MGFSWVKISWFHPFCLRRYKSSWLDVLNRKLKIDTWKRGRCWVVSLYHNRRWTTSFLKVHIDIRIGIERERERESCWEIKDYTVLDRPRKILYFCFYSFYFVAYAMHAHILLRNLMNATLIPGNYSCE